jgi:hypothetical protein
MTKKLKEAQSIPPSSKRKHIKKSLMAKAVADVITEAAREVPKKRKGEQ